MLIRFGFARACAIALLTLCPAVAFAQSEEDLAQAKLLGQEGLAFFDKGEYEAALGKLDEADRKARIPPLGLYAGRALARLGRLLEAQERFVQVTAIPLAPNSPEVWQRSKLDAQAELEKLLPTIPTVEVELVGVPADQRKTVTLTVDGREVEVVLGGIRLNPGEHSLVASYAGDSKSQTVKLDVGAKERVRFDFTKVPQAAEPQESGPNVLTIVGAVVASAGGAGLVVWGATGLAAMGKADDYGCNDDGRCEVADVSDLTTLRTVSTVSFYVGGGLALAGGGLLLAGLLGGEPSNEVALVPIVGPGFIGLSGKF